MRRLLAALLLLVVATSVGAQTAVVPTQSQPLNPAPVVSGTNAAAVVTITGVVNRRVHLISFKASCSAGTSTVTITDGGTTVWATTAGAIVTTDGGAIWIPPRAFTPGNTVVVTLGTCGAGNVGTLTVQADQR